MKEKQLLAADWHCPLRAGRRSLAAVYRELKSLGLAQDDIPFLVQLVENPKYDLPGFDLFPGGTDLDTHDYLHILLGRGLRQKDEAFVLGFTMGSTNRMGASEERLYSLCAKYLFPKAYRFNDEDIGVFRDAVRLGFISDCQPLDRVDLASLQGLTVDQARVSLGLEKPLLAAYFAIEKRRFPDAPESQRLL